MQTPSALPVKFSQSELVAQVREAETAFAASMAKRDFELFLKFIAEDAVFINGGNPLRGKVAIAGFWRKFFEQPAAPFSWRPEVVEVAAGGTLGYTEGPVLTPDGGRFAVFYTTWQRHAPGHWMVAFDNGHAVCKS